jgi:hypothetical protein
LFTYYHYSQINADFKSSNFQYKDVPYDSLGIIQVPNAEVNDAYNNKLIPYATTGRLIIKSAGRGVVEYHCDNGLKFRSYPIFSNLTSNSEIVWEQENINKHFYEWLIPSGNGHKLSFVLGTYDYDIGTEGFLSTGSTSYNNTVQSLIFFSLSRQGVVPFFYNLVSDNANLQITNITNGFEIVNKSNLMVKVSLILTRAMGISYSLT